MPEPVPVHLICGFLGAGKTTLLRRVIAEQPPEEPMVVIVNEFGELGIDGQLLDDHETDVVELASGCICCTLKNSFMDTLIDAIRKFSPRRIIVEASGLAKAGELSQAVNEVAAHRDVILKSLTTVVDAEIFVIRHKIGKMFFDQIETADLLLLNKIDLVPDAEVEDMVADLVDINPRARIMPVIYCAVDRDIILDPLGDQTSRASRIIADSERPLDVIPILTRVPGHSAHDHDHEHEHDHDHEEEEEPFVAFAFQNEGMLDPDCLNRFLDELPWELFRVKGFVRLPDGMSFLNYTYRRPELVPIEDNGPTRLAFVGWHIEPRKYLTHLEACLMTRG